MGETPGMIHTKTKFLSSCEPVKPNKLYTPNYNDGTGTGQRFLFQKINV